MSGGSNLCELIGFFAREFISEEISGHHYYVKIFLHLTWTFQTIHKLRVGEGGEEKEKHYGKGGHKMLPFGGYCRTTMQTRGIFWPSQETKFPFVQGSGCTMLCFLLFLHFSSVMLLKQICEWKNRSIKWSSCDSLSMNSDRNSVGTLCSN